MMPPLRFRDVWWACLLNALGCAHSAPVLPYGTPKWDCPPHTACSVREDWCREQRVLTTVEERRALCSPKKVE